MRGILMMMTYVAKMTMILMTTMIVNMAMVKKKSKNILVIIIC